MRHRHLGGIPLGFANACPAGGRHGGRFGHGHAAGGGASRRGEGISHAIGTGGRDLSKAVGGLMSLAALDTLGADAATEVIAVIGKPGAPAVRQAVEAKLRAIGKPAVVALLGQ